MDQVLDEAPQEYSQKIVTADLETLAKTQAAVAPDTKALGPGPSKTLGQGAAKTSTARSESKKTVKKTLPEATPPQAMPSTKAPLTLSWPLTLGEKSSYSLRWGVIEGGVATVEVKAPQIIEGVPALHYSGVVKSSKMMDLFYKINNSIDTWVRLSDLAPVRQEIVQNESARFGRRVMVMDHEKKEVKFYEHLTKTKGGVKEDKRTDNMTLGAQDIFGALYFYRFVQTVEGAYKYPIHDKGKNWFAELRFEGQETLRVPAGVFKAKRYKVAPRLEGQLKPRGDVVVWVSDDERSLLLKFNAKIKVGSVTGELIEHTPGQPIMLDIPHPLTSVEPLETKTVRN